MTFILSHPATRDEVRASDAVRRDVEEWEALSVAWLRSQYGEQLVSVIRHEDESHPHIHGYALPDDLGMKAAPLHPGFRAKAAVTSAGVLPGEDEKTLSKRANAAYQSAMRSWLDDYHQRVGQPCGLTRQGPGRRNLTRAAWHEEKRQAVALKEVLERADALRERAAAFKAHELGQAAALRAKVEAEAQKMRDEAASIRSDADRKADAAKAAIDAAKAAEERALEAATKAQRQQQAAERATTAARRLSGFGGALRGLWDGFRRSTIAARIRAEFMPTVEQWKQTAETAAQHAADANEKRRDLAATVKELRRSADVLGTQRDELRERLAAYEPASPTFAPAGPRPHP